MTRRTIGIGAFATGILLLACGGPSETTHAVAPASTTTSASTPAPKADLPAMSIRRSDVHAMIEAGMGAFLQQLMQRITLDDKPVFVAGKFHGFRVVSVRPEWGHVDLKAGDVITAVNGGSIEKPEEALETFKSLEVASEIRIAYERNGDPREIRYAIFDDIAAPNAKPAASAASKR